MELERKMMKRSLLTCIAIAILLVLFTSCYEKITPTAYTRFDPPDGVDVTYTARQTGNQIKAYLGHVLLMEFKFTRCTGKTTLDGIDYAMVDLEKAQSLEIAVHLIYDPEKNFYLNGEVLVPYGDVSVDGGNAVYHFVGLEELLKRTNTVNKVDPTKVNVIEYR